MSEIAKRVERLQRYVSNNERPTVELSAEAATTITTLRERVKVLEAGLRPFADEADNWMEEVSGDYSPLCVEPQSIDHKGGGYANPGSNSAYTIADLRAARSLLENTDG